MRPVFLLSPASCSGERARLLLRDEAAFPLAVKVKRRPGVAIGEVFAFLSGLYFRGKLAYALAFGEEALVITPTRGIVPAARKVTAEVLRAFAEVDIATRDARYRAPLERDARRLARRVGDRDVVLLGSIASDKYVDILGSVFGDRLKFPVAFVGRGDMSRGGLMLRCVEAQSELEYVPVAGAKRHGARPEKLPPKRRV